MSTSHSPRPVSTKYSRGTRGAAATRLRSVPRSPCACLCVGDRFLVAARPLAAAAFGAAERFLDAGGCGGDACPRAFRGNSSKTQTECYPDRDVRLFPECLLGAHLAEAVGEAKLRRLRAVPILSCGPDPNAPAAAVHRDGNDPAAPVRRDGNDHACAAAWWRAPSGREDLGDSLEDHPLPSLGSPRAFWDA